MGLTGGGTPSGPITNRTTFDAMEIATNLGLTTNLKLCLDAGSITSVVPDATKWLDLSGNGYDFFLGAAITDESTDPHFGVDLLGSVGGGAADGADATIDLTTLPVALQEGDLVVCFGGHSRVANAVGVSSAGWTQYSDDVSAAFRLRIDYKFMSSSPDTSITCRGSANVADGCAYRVWALRGIDPNNPIDVAAPTAATGTSTTPDPPAITTVTTNAVVLTAFGSPVFDTAATNPTESQHVTLVANSDTNSATVGSALRHRVTVGAYNPSAWAGIVSGNWVAQSMALRPKFPNSGLLSSNNFWGFGGGHYLTYDTTNEAWMQTLHKDNAIYSSICWVKVPDTADQWFWGDCTGNGIGVCFGIAALQPLLRARIVGAVVNDCVYSGSVPTNTWVMMSHSLTEATGAGGAIIGINDDFQTFTSTYVSPSASDAAVVFEIAARGSGGQPINLGGSMAMLCMWQGTALTEAELLSFFEATRDRFGV